MTDFGRRLSLVLFAALVLTSCWSAEPGHAPEPDNEPDVDALRSLGYVGSYRIQEKYAGKSGVARHDEERAHGGLNLYNTDPAPRAHLVDMNGVVVHTWAPQNETWPWHFVEMLDNGDLLAIAYQRFLMRLDWDSNILWGNAIPAHHDVSVYEGRIHVLTRTIEQLVHRGTTVTVLGDAITILSPEGEVLKNISLLPLLKEFIGSKTLDELSRATLQGDAKPTNDSIFDVLHTNTIEVLNATYGPVLELGNVLVAARSLDLIAVVDIESERVVWSWGPGHLEEPHMPTALENGNLLIFDNGTRRGYSRILELNPDTKTIEWEYRAQEPETFFTARGGASQALPNGNVLITESRNGRAFEITRDGQIVWEYFNPDVMEGNRRAWFYRLARYDPVNVPGRSAGVD